MITVQETDNLISVAVFGEFTLADYKEFEEHVLYKYRSGSQVNVLFDWRDMLSYTLDVAWE
ncbi:MAG: STAS/SEC14 domain-containing protein, partial [Nitrosospira sp.]